MPRSPTSTTVYAITLMKAHVFAGVRRVFRNNSSRSKRTRIGIVCDGVENEMSLADIDASTDTLRR